MNKRIKMLIGIALLAGFVYWVYTANEERKAGERATVLCDKLLEEGNHQNAYDSCYVAAHSQPTLESRRRYTLLAISAYTAASDRRILNDDALVSDMQDLIQRDKKNYHAQYIVGLSYWANGSSKSAREHLEIAIEDSAYRHAYKRFRAEYVDEGYELFMTLVGVPIPGLGQLKVGRTAYKAAKYKNKARAATQISPAHRKNNKGIAPTQDDEISVNSLGRASSFSDIVFLFGECKTLTQGRHNCQRIITPPMRVTVPPPRNGEFALNNDTKYLRILRSYKHLRLKEVEGLWTKGLTATRKVAEIPCHGRMGRFAKENHTVILTDVGISFRKPLERNTCDTFPSYYEGHYLHIVDIKKISCTIKEDWLGATKTLPCVEFKPRWTSNPRQYPILRFRNWRDRLEFMIKYFQASEEWKRNNTELMEIVLEKYARSRQLR